MWKETKDPELASSILELCDWMAEVQQWQWAPYADLRGRFYELTGRKALGLPVAVTDVLCLRGLTDGLALARELKDTERVVRYRRAISRGLRYLMRLQFSDEVELFYVPRRFWDRIYGGLRSSIYDNELRAESALPLKSVFDRLRPEEFNGR
jgi:hypothetical protein